MLRLKPSLATRSALALILALAGVQLVVFALVDQRPPNDHDEFYTDQALKLAHEVWEADPSDKLGLYKGLFDQGLHPQLPQAWLVAFMDVVGPSRVAFRLSNLPFLLLLVLGTWFAARRILGRNHAALATLLVVAHPAVVLYSRKWFQHFHAAALTSVCYALLLLSLDDRRGTATVHLGLGIALGIRLHTHPVIVPETALMLAVVVLMMVRKRRARGALTLLATVIVGAAPLGLVSKQYSLPTYLGGKRILDLDIDSMGELARELVVATWHSSFASLSSVVLVAGLLMLARGHRAEARSADPTATRVLLALLVLQVPLAAATVAASVSPEGWLHLLVPATILAVLGLERAADGNGTMTAKAIPALIALALLQIGLPLASSVPTEPFAPARPSWGEQLLTGGSREFGLNNHHFASSGPFGDVELARLVTDRQASRDPVGVLDLTWRPPPGPRGCDVPLEDGEWTEGVPSDQPAQMLTLPRWPWVFRGASGAPSLVPRSEDARVWLIRVWLDGSALPQDLAMACNTSTVPSPALSAAGLRQTTRTLGPGRWTPVADPAGRLAGPACDCIENPAYGGRILSAIFEPGQD